jgi:hypothetical protein
MKHTTKPTVALLLLLVATPPCWSAPLVQETTRIPLPGVSGRIDHLAVDLEGDRLFVAALGNGTVEVIDLKTQKAARSLKGFSEPQGVLYLPQLARLIVTDGKASHANVIDTDTLALVQQIALPEDSDNVRWETANGRVWLGAGSEQTAALIAIDPNNGKVVEKIGLRGHPESFQIEQQGHRIFVNVPTAHAVQVLDRKARRVAANWAVPAERNYPMALDEASHRLFVATRTPAQLVVYDTDSGRPVSSMPLVGDADDVFYDSNAHRLYATGGEGALQVFQQESADRFHLIESIPTRKGARTSLFVPEWRKLFVAVPQEGQESAEIRVFSVAP